MLHAPSHLSRVCGHSHFKKSWLMKTQNDNQATMVCEKSVLASSSSRSVPSSCSKGPDDKRSPQLCERGSSMKSLLSGGAPSSRPTRALVIGPVSVGAAHSTVGSGKHLSLVTCAESLSPPIRADPNGRSFRQSSPEQSSLDLKIGKNKHHEDDRSSLKSPPRSVSDVSATSSRCGSPPDLQRIDSADLAEQISFEREPLECEPTEPTQGQNTTFRVSAMRSLLRARAAGPGVQEPHPSQETDGIPLRASGAWLKPQFLRENSSQKELDCKDALASGPALLKKDIHSVKDPADNGIFRSPSGIFTAGGLNRSQDGKTPCKMWIPFILKGSPEESGAHVATGGDDLLEEVARTHSVNTITCDGINGRSTLRTCSICGTSKTPLWRSGPHGPKSLCNACGIRFKKSRKCPGSESSDLHVPPVSTPILKKLSSRSLKRKQDNAIESQSSWHQDDEDETAVKSQDETAMKSQVLQLHKRSRWPIVSLKKDGYGQGEDATGSSGESCLTWNLHSPLSGSPSPGKLYSHSNLATEEEEKRGMVQENKHSTVSRTYAKDEEEAAVLLMALSCGLVNA